MKLNLAAMSIFIGAVSATVIPTSAPTSAPTSKSTSKPTLKLTSSKANKPSSMMMSGKSGKGGKAGAKVYNNFISRAVPIRAEDVDYSELVFIQSDEEDPVVEVTAWCWDFEEDFYSGIDVYVYSQADEDLKVYGQANYCYYGTDSYPCTDIDGTIEKGSNDVWFTIFEKESGEPNNSPGLGAITIVGQETGRRWYIGVDGSSFLSTIEGPVCDLSGVIKTNFANTLADPYYDNSSGNGIISLVSESPKHFKGNL